MSIKNAINWIVLKIYEHTLRKYVARDIFNSISGNNTYMYYSLQKALHKYIRIIVSHEMSKSKESNINNKEIRLVFITHPLMSEKKIMEILKRAKYYLGPLEIEIVNNIGSRMEDISVPVIITSETKLTQKNKKKISGRIFNVDYLENPFEGWEWHHLLNVIDPPDYEKNINESHIKLKQRISVLKEEFNFDKTYVFGTGPSLAKATRGDFSNGYRIVCNTLVKDKSLWHKIKPNFIVAADAIFHFGFNRYAKTFRKDLKKRLKESRNTVFVYPLVYHQFILREFANFSDQLLPIPTNDKYSRINVDLQKRFYLPHLGNVLTYVLLPLACTITKNIYLWGFDGRSPNDKLFWGHSEGQSYDNMIKDIADHHPAFFEFQIPKNNPTKYVKENLGKNLEFLLQQIEKKGFRVISLHKSWTIPINIRQKES